jgi:hypothetical protein
MAAVVKLHRTPDGTPTTVAVVHGVLHYAFDRASALEAGDALDVYAGDYLVGSCVVATGEAEAAPFTGRISLHALPFMEFPIELRTVLRRTAREIAPAVLLRDAVALLSSAGAPRIRAELTAVQDRSVSFDLTVETLPDYPREFFLAINGKESGRATSRPAAHKGPPPSLLHALVFRTEAMLSDGDYVKIAEAATGTTVYANAITWMTIMGPVLTSLRRLQARYDLLAALFDRAQSRMDALGNISRDRQLLDRLDMFYFLINDRMDREVKWLAGRIDPGVEARVAPDPSSAAKENPDRRSPYDIDGVGFYGVETDGVGSWRWFGPHVTLLLKNVSPGARAITLQFGTIAAGVILRQLQGSINGLPLLPEFTANPGGGHRMTIPVAAAAMRPDRAVIINLSFDQAYKPPGDTRALCATFIQADILSR